MLRIEVADDNELDIPTGTYKLNTAISNSINICELFNTQYEGYVKIENPNEVEIYKYRMSTEKKIGEYCIEEILPNKNYEGIWNEVVYKEQEKYELLEKILKIEKSNKKIREAFGINKCVLIYGEPGTGKSSLSKGLVQKLAIRRGERYVLKRIRCSQIFSRFYGESTKILESIFSANNNLLDDNNLLNNKNINNKNLSINNLSDNTVIENNRILSENNTINIVYIIDEIDSILMDRKLLFSKNEPNDSLRIINLFLNEIDSSKNLFIFTTNFKEELDKAFLSRCDVIFEMKMPQHEEIYGILKRTIEKGYFKSFVQFSEFSNVKICEELADEKSVKLFKMAERMVGKSPREIKKELFNNRFLYNN